MTERKTITLPVTLDKASRRKDKSISIHFSSAQQIGTPEFAAIDTVAQSEGWLMFSANRFTDADVPKDDAPVDTKKPSQRLRAVLFLVWRQQEDGTEDFDAYYRRVLEKIINTFKAELEP